MPPPRRAALNIPALNTFQCWNVSEEGNIISILQAGEIVRSVLHDTENVGFFTQAFQITNHEDHDCAEAARVLFDASNRVNFTLQSIRAGAESHMWRRICRKRPAS